ncbi:MAG: hypothetical protein AAF092_03555 [Pseudomonadota bacterium]
MTATTSHRGGAAVGFVTDLGPVEAGAVLYLRLWRNGPDAQARVWSDFKATLGSNQGRDALSAFEHLCEVCMRHGRRPLVRHHVNCQCLGADESCFANFIGYATDGAREDALLIATTIVRPDIAPVAVACAQQFGLALRQMTSLQTNATPQFNCGPTTIH